MPHGLVVAAPRTGSGKTTVTLALLRAFARRDTRVASAKIGPDFIDPRFHEAASGTDCITLDSWAMRADLIGTLLAGLEGADLVVVEGVMGLFDGAAQPGLGSGATAEMAARLDLPVVLVVDASGLGQSIAALVEGFCRHDPGVTIAGLVLNNVGSERHRRILREALAPTGLPIFGMLPREPGLSLPSRHLGLVQAGEAADLDGFLDAAAALAAEHLDLEAFQAAAREPATPAYCRPTPPIPPPGLRIALASDAAFGFLYPHILRFWREAGAEILPFSPLDDQPPDPTADAIWLPGGYPELHAGRLAAARTFRTGMVEAARRSCAIHGECGGYMVLGQGLVDGDGQRHEMLGLLPLETSFATRRLHLGYRHVALATATTFAGQGTRFRGHEFHYSVAVREDGPPLFRDVEGTATYGLALGRVSGSYLHVIDRSDARSREDFAVVSPLSAGATIPGEASFPSATPAEAETWVPRSSRGTSKKGTEFKPIGCRSGPVLHGGDLRAAEKRYGRHDWLDLSTGINPDPWPVPPLPPDTWARLPAPDDLGALLAAARGFYGTRGAIVAAPGTQALLQALPGLFPGRRAAWVAPGYGGYREAWPAIRAVAEADPDGADVLILGRPNNPDGRILPAESLLSLADRLAARDGLLVVDEAFADPDPGTTLAAEAGRPGLLVLRSFGKFFGLAGLRLGFALGAPALVDRIATRLGPWAVSGPALAIAAAAFADVPWIARTRAHLPRAAARLDALLLCSGLDLVGGTPLFRLIATPTAASLHDRLARAGIWTRRFDEAPTRLRFGLPGPEADWTRLETTLSTIAACPKSTSAT